MKLLQVLISKTKPAADLFAKSCFETVRSPGYSWFIALILIL